VEPVDDLRASNPPSNAELWSLLNREFVEHGYDMKHVMRLILNSRTYQLSSETVPDNETDTRFYSHYYARRCLRKSCSTALPRPPACRMAFKATPSELARCSSRRPGVGSYFLTLFGRSERVTACACERAGEVTLPQLLHLQNSEDLQRRSPTARGG
jgi:hypothetical protein